MARASLSPSKDKEGQGRTSLSSRIILLLVEDSATCEAIRPLLQADPFVRYAIVEKETGATGLEALRSVKTHAVLLAGELPDMKAQQWLTELSRANDLHKPPVIALLDKANPELEEELLQAGACFCLRSSELSPSVLQQALHCAIELVESKRTIAGQKLELLERRLEFPIAAPLTSFIFYFTFDLFAFTFNFVFVPHNKVSLHFLRAGFSYHCYRALLQFLVNKRWQFQQA